MWITILEAICLFTSIVYIYNPVVAKHPYLVKIATNKISKLFLLVLAYYITNQVSMIIGIQLALAVGFIEYDYSISTI